MLKLRSSRQVQVSLSLKNGTHTYNFCGSRNTENACVVDVMPYVPQLQHVPLLLSALPMLHCRVHPRMRTALVHTDVIFRFFRKPGAVWMRHMNVGLMGIPLTVTVPMSGIPRLVPH